MYKSGYNLKRLMKTTNMADLAVKVQLVQTLMKEIDKNRYHVRLLSVQEIKKPCFSLLYFACLLSQQQEVGKKDFPATSFLYPSIPGINFHVEMFNDYKQ